MPADRACARRKSRGPTALHDYLQTNAYGEDYCQRCMMFSPHPGPVGPCPGDPSLPKQLELAWTLADLMRL